MKDGGARSFEALNGLRGVWALMVIFEHIGGPVTTALFLHRILAVDFFFCLSGFVLAHVYGEALTSGRESAVGFIRSRLIRLYPLYALGMFLGIGSVLYQKFAMGLNVEFDQIAKAGAVGILFLPCPNKFEFQRGELYPLNNPSWSLLFELIANAIYGMLGRYLTLPVLAILLPLFASYLVLTVHHYGNMDGGWAWYNIDLGFARVLFPFFAGVALYKLRAHFTVKPWPLPVVLLGFLGIVAMPLHHTAGVVFEVFANLTLIPILLFFAAETPCGGFMGKVASMLGYLSYGIYMIHVPLRAVFTNVLGEYGISKDTIAFIVAGVAGLIAFFATRFYDTPFRRWLKQFLTWPRRRLTQPTAQAE